MMYKQLMFFLPFAIFICACAPDKPPTKKSQNKTEHTSSSADKPKAASGASSFDAEVKGTTEPTEDEAATGSPMPPENIKKAEEIIAETDTDAIAAVDGKAIYKTRCSVCHGFKGDMMLNGAKDLRKLRTSLAQRVAQVYFGRGVMKPFEGVLSNPEIVAVAKYVETLRK